MKQMKVKMYLHILITLFIMLITSASFAIYTDRNDYSAKANIEAMVGSGSSEYIFTATSIKNFSLNVSDDNLSESKVGNYIESDTGTIKVNLDNTIEDDVTCTFDLLYTWTSEDKYLTPSVALPYTSGGKTYNYEFSTIVNGTNERDLSKVNNGTGFDENYSGTIAEGLSITASSNESSEISYNITSRFYNLPVDQGDIMGKKMSSTIKVDNVVCNKTEYVDPDPNININNLEYLSTNSGNSVLNLVERQGVNITNVDSIYFVNTRNMMPDNGTNVAYFRGMNNRTIRAWSTGTSLYIGSHGTTYPGPSMVSAFEPEFVENGWGVNAEYLPNINITKIDMNNVNMTYVSNMSSMFYGLSGEDEITINLGDDFDASNVTDMSWMFSEVGSYGPGSAFINLGNKFNTSKVTNMTSMFEWSDVEKLNLGSHFNTSKVTNMSNMFSFTGFNSENFTLNLGNQFNTSNVTSMSQMFSSAGYLSTNFTLNLGNEFNTSKVTNMLYMFYKTGYSSSWTLNLKSFDFSKVGSNYNGFFYGRSSSNILTVLCSSTNGDFINARASGLSGYNVVCS